MTPTPGTRFLFKHNLDAEHAHLSGRMCILQSIKGLAENFDSPVFVVWFEDGTVIEALGDELHDPATEVWFWDGNGSETVVHGEPILTAWLDFMIDQGFEWTGNEWWPDPKKWDRRDNCWVRRNPSTEA